MAEKVLEAIKINKHFAGAQVQHVLKDVSFSINKGDFASIVGKSGCGKSTLLYILSTMDTDYEGDLLIDNQPMRLKTEAELARVRNEKIGYKIREHAMQKVPYQLVAGDREKEQGLVAVRTRSGEDLGTMTLDAFIEKLRSEIPPVG